MILDEEPWPDADPALEATLRIESLGIVSDEASKAFQSIRNTYLPAWEKLAEAIKAASSSSQTDYVLTSRFRGSTTEQIFADIEEYNAIMKAQGIVLPDLATLETDPPELDMSKVRYPAEFTSKIHGPPSVPFKHRGKDR
jgi:hypothetical protein